MDGRFLARLTALMVCAEGLAGHALGEATPTTLQGRDGVEATFAHANGGYRFVGYRDLEGRATGVSPGRDSASRLQTDGV